jgi:hypothetical protein
MLEVLKPLQVNALPRASQVEICNQKGLCDCAFLGAVPDTFGMAFSSRALVLQTRKNHVWPHRQAPASSFQRLLQICRKHLSGTLKLVKHTDFSENFRNKPDLEPTFKKSGKQPKQEVSGLKKVF